MKILYLSVLITLFMLWPSFTNAQPIPIKKQAIDVHVGLHHYQNRDNLGSPLKYQGTEKSFGFSYHHQNPFRKRQIHTTLIFGKPQSQRYKKATHIYSHIQYDHHRRLKIHRQGNASLWAGGMWNTAFSLRNYNYTKNHAETTYELISALHVSIFETVNLTPNNQIILGTHMPFLAYISRSHYALYDETFLDDIIEGKSLALAVLKDGKLTSLHEYFKLTIYLQYYYTLSPSWRTGLHYQWAYDRYTQPQTISTLTNAFTLSFMRTF